jgi:hypothetical protein
MKQLFKIDESEKRRILEMHQTATRKNYLSEQENTATPNQPNREPFTSASGVRYKLPAITSDEILSKFININDGNVDVSWLQGLGFPKTLPKAGGPEGRNTTDAIFRLLRDYVDAAGQLVAKNEILCGGGNFIDALTATAEASHGGNVNDIKSLYAAAGGEQKFKDAVKKILQTQINKIGGCQA